MKETKDRHTFNRFDVVGPESCPATWCSPMVAIGCRTSGGGGENEPRLMPPSTTLTRSSLLCDDRLHAIIARVVEVELHDEVMSWMNTLGDTEWQRAVIVIDRLAELGPNARMPLSRSLGAGLFELRFTLGATARRITYRFTTDSRIVLLTTFRKQRNNERNEVTRARAVAEACAVENP